MKMNVGRSILILIILTNIINKFSIMVQILTLIKGYFGCALWRSQADKTIPVEN